jgi:molybdate-binding protein/DNA-binding XRE family transcriptional regulator
MIMADLRQVRNAVKGRRLERSWSQLELAGRAGISRAAVSAIEINRLVPSVAAALALAQSLDCSVEDLFGSGQPPEEPQWAWPPPQVPCRFWQATVGGRRLLYPAETTASGVLEHDGLYQNGLCHFRRGEARGTDFKSVLRTLVLASCDPAAALLASEIHQRTGTRVIIFPRSSQQALALLASGLIHAAGLHLATPQAPKRNERAVRDRLGSGFQLLRVARWQEGLAVSTDAGVSSVRTALRTSLRWVGRQEGSAARLCQDELLGTRRPPRRVARDHRWVAEAIRSGWADAGVCLRLVSDEAGLRFFGVRQETYEWCFSATAAQDPALQALLHTVRSSSYRRLLNDLPGYDARECGELQQVI